MRARVAAAPTDAAGYQLDAKYQLEASDDINDRMLEKAETDIKEAGLQLFSQAEVKSSIGVEREG